jgi:nudix-type nucleoside diphosphatase (YffH/AdpP family)
MSDDEAMTGNDDREVYSGRILKLQLRYVELADGRRHLREIVEHRPGAAAVAVDDSGQVLLVRQLRPAVGRAVLELPAGLIDPGEQPRDTARRELEEETGFAAEQFELLVAFYTSPGFTDELIHIYAASGLRETAMRHDEEEEIELVRMPLAKAIEQVMRGEISDAKTVAGLLAYARSKRP